MNWQSWTEQLRQTPGLAVSDLLRGAADIAPFERVAPHEFLLAILPRNSRLVSASLLGEPNADTQESALFDDLPDLLDTGLTEWLLTQRQASAPSARKFGAHVVQVCEALQWPQYFRMPRTRVALTAERALWIKWLSGLTLSAYRDPEFEYWRVLAVEQADDGLQFFWQYFVVEAGRTRSERYLNLGLLAFAKLPLSEDDSLRNLRLQVQALINRYQRRKAWGTPALDELARELRGVMARNPSMRADHYRMFVADLLQPLGTDRSTSVLGLLGFNLSIQGKSSSVSNTFLGLRPPGLADETDVVVRTVRNSSSLAQAWNAVRPLLLAHENYLRKSGDAYDFVRTLDRCGRALCDKYSLSDPEIRDRLLQWIHLALRVETNNPRLWMLWELTLRTAGHLQRAQWALCEMTRRFPEYLPCRVELARLLAESDRPEDHAEAKQLLCQVLEMDPQNLHAHAAISQLAIKNHNWPVALENATRGLQIDPENEHCAVLLAKAYARRDEVGDLQTAIDQLQRFVGRYRGKFHAEHSLQNLLKRQRLIDQGKPLTWKDDEKGVDADLVAIETDPTWLAFAESIKAGSPMQNSPDDGFPAPTDRLLPLPQALKYAVTNKQWGADVLALYDATTRQAYPLETRLWRYLQTLGQPVHGSAEQERAKADLQGWIELEKRDAGLDDVFWQQYMTHQWDGLATTLPETAVQSGSAWLEQLLDRYRPMPAPLLA